MGSASSRRPPWPYTALVAGMGVRCRGDIVGKKVEPLGNAVPTSQEYGDDDLYRERSFAFRAPLGYGESVQRSHLSRRCRYGLNVWFAGNQRGKGPKWNNIAPASTGSVRDFVEALHGGVVTQFILAGRYILRRTSDLAAGQTVSKDFGAGRTITSAARFKPTGGTDSLHVTLDNGDLYSYDGANWSASPAAAAGAWNGDALLCVVVGDQFFIQDTANTTRLATADPMVGTNYSGQHIYGDGSLTINGLTSVGGQLVALMDSGEAFGLNEAGGTEPLTTGLATTPATTNGSRPAADARGFLYWRVGGSWFRMAAGGNPEPIGPERLIDNDTEVSGVAQAFAWYGAYYGFFGLYNDSNGASYLTQFGDWLPNDDEDGYVFVETFNGALVKWAGRQLSAMRVQAIGGVPRLYVGFTNGTYGFVKLPQNTPNPFAPMSGCEFADGSTGASECFWPRHTMMKPREKKANLDVAEFGTVLDADNYVTVAARTDFSGAYTTVGTLIEPGQLQEFPDNTIGVAIDLKETFISPSSASTPVVEALVLKEQLRPALRLEYTLPISARHRVGLMNGATDRKTPDQIKAHIKSCVDSPSSVQIVLPDEVNQNFNSITYQEVIPHESRRHGLEYELLTSFVQYRTNEIYGIYARFRALTFGDLGTMTFAEAGVY